MGLQGGAIDRKNRVIFALVLNQILSAGTHLIAKGTLNAIGPLSTALLRFTGASITLLLFHFLRPRRERVAREDIPKLLWLGFGERFGPAFFVGAALILFGVSWVETRKSGILPPPARVPAR